MKKSFRIDVNSSKFKLPKNKLNLLVIGASGGVANAFLHHLSDYRNLFNKVVLLDRDNKVLEDTFIDHELLNYTFIHKDIVLPEKEKEYLGLLSENKIDVVLDITDMNSLEIIAATNKAGISYINTAMNDDKKTVSELLREIYPKKNKINKAPHILCTGMNPGNVNMWVRYGIEKFGIPKGLTHFEYDTSKVAKKWHPMMTWSIHEFLIEAVRDPSGIVLGKNKVKKLLPNALENRKSMERILKPIMKLNTYPQGLTVLHEENLSIGFKYNIPSKFIYAVNPKTMDVLTKIYERKGNVTKNDLELGDNTNEILDGADSIGVILDYHDKQVYYFNTISNVAVIGTNATYTQVIVGIFAAIFTLLFDKLKPAVYFVEDLYDTHYRYFMFDNMRIQEFVFSKHKNSLKLNKYHPMIKVHRKNRFEHLYII
jgi:homospermidine synthase